MGTTVPDYPRGITFEQIWAAIHADREATEARKKEFDREMQERQEKIDKEMRELKESQRKSARELNKQLEKSAKQLNKQLGALGNRFGEMIECMVLPNMVRQFRKLGFVFTKAYRDGDWRDENDETIADVDITLENGDKVMLVEVKSKPSSEDITDHVRRIENVRVYADKRNDNRKYLGGIAGMVFGKTEKEFAFKTGFYVIEPSGETFKISAPKGSYSPREW